VYGSLVSVIVQATNNIGSGEFSQPSVMGSTVQTEPQSVKNVRLDPTQSTTTSVLLEWDALFTDLETGGSPVLNYKISINLGLTITSWSQVAVIASNS
jgi:hypothetical protein